MDDLSSANRHSKPRGTLATFRSAAFSVGTKANSLKISLVVGTALVLINHHEMLRGGEFPGAAEVVLTYAVPYLVATFAAVVTKRSQRVCHACGVLAPPRNKNP